MALHLNPYILSNPHKKTDIKMSETGKESEEIKKEKAEKPEVPPVPRFPAVTREAPGAPPKFPAAQKPVAPPPTPKPEVPKPEVKPEVPPPPVVKPPVIIEKAIVIDNGSGYTKCGFSGKDEPDEVFPTVIGKPKYGMAMPELVPYAPDVYIGKKAMSMRGALKLEYPIEHGIIRNWEAMERIWYYTFHGILNVDPSKYNVLLSEPPANPSSHREKMAEIMFEKFNVAGMYVGMQALLSLYAANKTTGVILDVGDGVTHVVPIFGGYVIAHAINRVNLGGRDITRFLVRLLRDKDIYLTSSAEFEIVRDIKEKRCYVALDLEAELKKVRGGQVAAQRVDRETYVAFGERQEMQVPPTEYKLPDGRTLTINEERFLAPEVLFQPQWIGLEAMPVHWAVFDSVLRCDIDLRRELLANIILSGGSTLFPGFEQRLKKELLALANQYGMTDVDIRITSPPNRMYSVWIGGSKLASHPSFAKSWITREEYKKEGPQVIHRAVRRGALIPYLAYL